ncbi:hypothetical protein V5799_011058, partial [Amblyomma americanum]
KHCLRFPGRQPKIPLTPWKVAVLRDCFRDRLQAKGMPPGLLTSGLKEFNRFVSEKIADIEKLAKRELAKEMELSS